MGLWDNLVVEAPCENHSRNALSYYLVLQPTKILSKVHEDLVADKISTVASAKAFMKMLKSFRNAGKQTIAEVLTSPDSYYTV